MPRLFVAVDVPDEEKDRLQAVSVGLPGASWVRDRQFHVTLSFLGEVDGPGLRAVSEALHGVRGEPFELTLRGVGHFPPRGEPRVLWAGLEPSPELNDLHRRVHSVLKRAGHGHEERNFAPHVTLARLNHAPLPRLLEWMTEHMPLQGEPFLVSEVLLYSSVLSSGGAQHRLLAPYPLFAARPVRRRAP